MTKRKDRVAAHEPEWSPFEEAALDDDDDEILRELVGDPVPERERAIWTLMDSRQREEAIRRARALIDWNGRRREASAELAAERAGVTPVRFYQLNAKWRKERSLANLGMRGAPARTRPGRTKAEVVNAAQAIVPRLVDADGGASIRRLAIRLGDEIARRTGLSVEEVPGHNTLRTFVERELQRRAREGKPGNELLLDHVAAGVLRLDGSAYTLFLLIDRNSHLILGASIGDAEDVGRGYRAAAADALVRLAEPGPFARLDWASPTARLQVVPGASGGFGDAGPPDPGAGIGFEVTSPRGIGSYVGRYVGRAIDAIPLWRSRTGVGLPPPHLEERAPRLDAARAAARVRVAVDRHDAAILQSLNRDGGGPPPADLLARLQRLAG